MPKFAIGCHHPKNTKLVTFGFLSTILFNITAYKSIWSLELLARVFNILTLLLFTIYFVNSFLKESFDRKIVFFYLLPGILVYAGSFINLLISSFQNVNILSQFGTLIPWAIYLSIPGLLKYHRLNVFRLLSFFDSFMFVAVSMALVEYYFIFSGFLSPRSIRTIGGNFVAGISSILFVNEQGFAAGQLYYRFYGPFLEPGTLAMFLLPVIAYSFIHRKYFHLLIYLYAIFLTDSLGGFIGIALLFPLLFFFRFRRFLFISLTITILSLFLIFNLSSSELKHRYEAKNLSASVREDSFSNFFKYLPELIFRYPLGLPRTESTDESMNIDLYSGGTNSLANAYNGGGVFTFVGFFMVLCVSLWYSTASLFSIRISLDEQAAIASIICSLTFIFQRTTIWEFPVFSLLYAPFVINFLIRDKLANSNSLI